MESFGIDLALTPINAVKENFATGLIYVFLVAALAALYFAQQKMVASRTVSPTMSATQAKVMQYLPVFFAVFQLFLPTGLIVYYMVQAIIRIGQQQYITQRFYGNDSSLGRQAQAAGERAREMSKNDKESSKSKKEVTDPKAPFVSKRVTPPKGGFSSAKQSTPPGKNRSNAIPRKPKKS
jgi:YidC/Oxa1 family membrane protein insertase